MRKTLFILILSIGAFLGASSQSKASMNEDPSSKYLRFFPNPAVSVINFEFTSAFDRNATVEIYNFIGKKVYTTRTTSAKITIPLTDFFRGLYIFQLRDRNGKIIESGKFQVAK